MCLYVCMRKERGAGNQDTLFYFATMNKNTSGSWQSLEEYFAARQREENSTIQFPSTVMLVLIIVVGIIGNTLVLIVYGRGFRKGPFSVAILFVTGLDLASCLFLIPVDIRVSYGYPGDAVCKTRHFISGVFIVGSSLALVQLAVIRYRKVCHPFAWQVTTRKAVVYSVAILVLSLGVSSPLIVLKGRQLQIRPVPDSFMRSAADWIGNTENITIAAANDTILTNSSIIRQWSDTVVYGYSCSTEEAWVGSAFPLLINGLLLFAFVVTSVVMTALYVLIGREAWRGRLEPKILEVEWKRDGQGPRKFFRMFSLERETGIPEATPLDSVADLTSFTAATPDNDDDEEVERVASGTKLVLFGVSGEADERGLPRSPPTDVTQGTESSCCTPPHVLTSPSGDETNPGPRNAQERRKRSMIFNTASRMFIVISASFILGNLISVTAAAIKTGDPRGFLVMSLTRRAVIFFFLRVSYINCAVNPLVYSFWDPGFRNQCLALFKRT